MMEGVSAAGEECLILSGMDRSKEQKNPWFAGEENIKYKGTLIVVQDCDRAFKFYSDMFGFRLVHDNDGNMELTDHLYLQESGYWESFTGKKSIPNNNRSELYFEGVDIDGFY